MQTEELKIIYAKKAAEAYRKKDTQDWISALFCSRIVGNYERGATLGLASDMGVSTDTIEDRAHAYMLFERLCRLDGGKFRLFIFNARRLPYIYLSHFRALYDHQLSYSLTDDQILDLLMDVVQGEGNISSRNLENHIRSRYGDTRDWTHYAQRLMKEVNRTLQQPDLPDEGRQKLSDVYNWLGDNS